MYLLLDKYGAKSMEDIKHTPKGISKSDIFIQPMAGVKMADFESHWVNVARRNIKCDTFGYTKSVAFYIALGCNTNKILSSMYIILFVVVFINILGIIYVYYTIRNRRRIKGVPVK